MPSFKDEPEPVEAGHWRGQYEKLFVACLLAWMVFVGLNSLGEGLPGFEHNLWARSGLLASFAQLRLALGDRVFLEAVVGNTGWLNYIADTDDYQNVSAFSPDDLESIQSQLTALAGHLKTYGGVLVLVVAPNKDTIYPDQMPVELHRFNQQSRLDQLLSYLNGNDVATVLDLRPALLQARQEYQLYYKTDTHWTAYGAYIAYATIMRALTPVDPALLPNPIEKFAIFSAPPAQRDLALYINADSLLESAVYANFPPDVGHADFLNPAGQTRFPSMLTWTSDVSQPTLVMYHDSFGSALRVFFSPHFQRAAYIWAPDQKIEMIDMKWIDQYQPKVVIIEIVERNLSNLKLWLPDS